MGRNIAENLARLGERVVLLSAVGDDGSGRRILQQAAECGIDISHVLVDADHRTAAYLAVLDDTGDLVMSIDDMSINRELITPDFIYRRRALFRDARMIVLDANLSAADAAAPSLAWRAGTVCRSAPTRPPPPWPRACAPTCRTSPWWRPTPPKPKALCGVQVTDRESALVAAQKLVAWASRSPS